MRWRRISPKLLHPSLQRSHGNSADAIFTVWAVSSRTSTNLCKNPSRPALQLDISYMQASARAVSTDLFAHVSTEPFFFFFFWLIQATAPGTEFKAKPWSAASSPRRRGQFCWRRDEPLMCSTRCALDAPPRPMETESIAGQQPCESTRGLLSSAR